MKIQRLDNFQCVNHPARDGVGICMTCKSVVCDECSTKIDGINTCLGCLNRKVGKQRKAPGLIARSANLIFGVAALLFALPMLVGLIFITGMEIPNSQSWSLGNKVFRNREIVQAMTAGVKRFETDVGRYPRSSEGFHALEWAKPSLGKKPQGWDGSYWPASWEIDVTAEDGLPLDAWGTPLEYWWHPALSKPIIASAGPDRVFDTRLGKIVDRIKSAPSGEIHLFAEGDDFIATPRN